MNDLRLQMGPMGGQDGGKVQFGGLFRFGRENGWHCGHWHNSVAEALLCIHPPRPPRPAEPKIKDYIKDALADA